MPSRERAARVGRYLVGSPAASCQLAPPAVEIKRLGRPLRDTPTKIVCVAEAEFCKPAVGTNLTKTMPLPRTGIRRQCCSGVSPGTGIGGGGTASVTRSEERRVGKGVN